jgi:uncharacterized protein (DUF1778 family)
MLRNKQIMCLVTEEELDIISKAALAEGRERNRSNFMVRAALEKANHNKEGVKDGCIPKEKEMPGRTI